MAEEIYGSGNSATTGSINEGDKKLRDWKHYVRMGIRYRQVY